MIDFIDNYYTKSYFDSDSLDKERAKKKAFSTIMPIIMQEELTPMQSLCFRYKYENNKTQTEIASLLKLSQHISTAKDKMNNQLGYCYIALSKAIDEYDRLSNQM